MNNEQLIKSAHIWALAVIVFFGVVVFASKGRSHPSHLAQQNANENTNTNANRNQNQNSNANTANANANNSNTSGEQGNTSALSSRDRKFVTDAAMAGMTEVELGRWAAQKGTSEEVKQFGRRMVDDHSKANKELIQLASSKGLTLPTELDQKHQNNVRKVSRLTGAEFDRAYSKMMLKEHEDAVKDFEKQSTNGDDADLKAFAAKTLPTLQEHLQMARTLPGNAGTGSGNDNGNRNINSDLDTNRNSNRNNNGNGNSNSNSNSNSNRNNNGNSNRP